MACPGDAANFFGGGDGVSSSEQGPGARPWSPLTRVSVQTGCPWGGGAGAVVHMGCDRHGRLCRDTRGTEGGGTAAPAALRRQVRYFAPIGKAGPPAGNKNTRRGVTSGNAHPRSRSSRTALSCYSPTPLPGPCAPGDPSPGVGMCHPLSADRWGTVTSARRSHPRGRNRNLPRNGMETLPAGAAEPPPACLSLALPTAGCVPRKPAPRKS